MDVTSGVPGVNAPDPETYEEFWPYYVSQHLHPATRAIHVGATSAAGVVGAAGIVSLNPLLVAVAPVIGYGPAWASHFLIEKNKPATFEAPLWSLISDYRMCGLFLSGRLGHELMKYQIRG